MGLSKDKIEELDYLAKAIVLAPHKMLAEGTAQWSAGDKYDFEKKAEGQPLEKQLSIFLAMRDNADAAAKEIAEKEAARAARAPEEKAEFDEIRRQAQARQDAKAEAREQGNTWDKTMQEKQQQEICLSVSRWRV